MVKELENPYFDLQAEMGITKHPGGVKSTNDLIELCHIDKDSYVLDVGCGVGRSACYIAKKTGCRIIGVDLSERMVDRAREMAKRRGVEGRVKFIVANAEGLPFDKNIFDAVISESVTAFTEKAKAMAEYVRVTKKGGYIGLNETTWIRTPTKEIIEYMHRGTGNANPETRAGWKKLLEDAGLEVLVAKSCKVNAFSQAYNEMRLTGLGDSFRAGGRMFALLFKPEYLKAMKDLAKTAIRVPKGLMKTLGTGIYVGRK